jgi:hypothetical protein
MERSVIRNHGGPVQRLIYRNIGIGNKVPMTRNITVKRCEDAYRTQT